MNRSRAASSDSKLRVLSIGVVGTIGAADRQAVAAHPDADIVGLSEGGTLTLGAEGPLKIWRNGKSEPGLRMPGLPEQYTLLNHWHAWVDNCLGRKTELHTPFQHAVRITEATLLAVKATRFPGQELLWDKSNLLFSNHAEATNTIVRRQYREGFAPSKID